MPSIAIIGVGPWGVCALERIVSAAREGDAPDRGLRVEVVEPQAPGSGVYDIRQPDYLLLNNSCGELSLYTGAGGSTRPEYGLGLHEWATEQGYRWVGERCVRETGGEPLERHHFLPRRLMGEYLQWFYRALCAAAPAAGVRIIHHPVAAVDVVSRRDGSEEIHLDGGGVVVVDHVIVTSGHTANREVHPSGARPPELPPYPVDGYADRITPESTVAISGMGLVAVDVITALTVGRGGRYVEAGGGGDLRYVRSGREPTVQMFSRSGLPFTAKSVTGVDRSLVYEPVIATPTALAELRGLDRSRAVDVRRELLPLLFGEMSARYYAQLAYRRGALPAAREVRAALRDAWASGRSEDELTRLSARYGPFDPAALFFGHRPSYADSADYERSVYDSIAADLREAEVPDGYSPTKLATEVFRIFRDPMRAVVEQGGLSLDSYLDFNDDIRSRIHRLVAGPPALRSRQVLALLDAGVLHAPYGPAPALGDAVTAGMAQTRPPSFAHASADGPGGRGSPRGVESISAMTRVSSTSLGRSYDDDADHVIRGRLGDPRIDGTASELLARMHARGRLSQFRYGSVTVGSIDLTPDSHPIGLDGRAQPRLWMFGVLTEGVRHFTQYLPSPRSRMRAVEELGACVRAILS